MYYIFTVSHMTSVWPVLYPLPRQYSPFILLNIVIYYVFAVSNMTSVWSVLCPLYSQYSHVIPLNIIHSRVSE